MSTTIGKLNFMVAADSSGVISGLKPGESAIQRLQGLASGFTGQIAALTGALSITGAAGWGVRLAAEAETAKIGFTGLLGSGDKATSMLKQLKDMAKATPFEFTELRLATQGLLGIGMATEQVLPSLQMLGDISAGSGKDLQELTGIFAQVQSSGRLMTGDMNQLAMAGIPIIKKLSEHFGITAGEVRKMAERGEIDLPTFTRVMQSMTEKGGLYFGQMEEKAKSLIGRWSTLMDSAKELATSFGDNLLPTLKKMVETGTRVIDWVNGLSTATAKSVIKTVAMTGAFAAAVTYGPKIVTMIRSIVTALRAMAVGQATVQALSGPRGWLVLAGGLAAAAVAAGLVEYQFSQLDESLGKATQTAKGAAAAVASVKGETQKTAAALQALDNADPLSGITTKMQTLEQQTEAANEALRKQRDLMNRFPGQAAKNTAGGFEAQLRARNEGKLLAGHAGGPRELVNEFAKAGKTAEEIKAAVEKLADELMKKEDPKDTKVEVREVNL